MHNLGGVKNNVFVAEVVGISNPAKDHLIFVSEEIVEVSGITV